MIPRQGEVWWAEAADKQRPVLIVSRSDVVPMLNAIVCAPITKKVRGIPTEIPLGRAEGLKVQCAASFDNLQLIRRSLFGTRIGALTGSRRMICEALSALADC
ncbi:MAG: type II toxin-antitoxin system PemK/MazF family toxin [Actinomycetota bacterium]